MTAPRTAALAACRELGGGEHEEPRLRVQVPGLPRRHRAVVRASPDLGQPVPVPHGVPWYPDDLDAWSVRWVLMHLVSETARHAGHADIVREAVDAVAPALAAHRVMEKR